MFFTTFENLCAKKGKTPTAVGNELGIAKTTVSYWRNKKGVIPKQDILLKLAEYFNVSTDYLLGVEEIKKDSSSSVENELSEYHRKIIALFDSARPEYQAAAIALLESAPVQEQVQDEEEVNG